MPPLLLWLLCVPALADEVVLWQGFQHMWERTAGGFRVPHRVSLFQSHLGGPTEAPTFTFAQNTGVDGDFMYPEGYGVRIASDDLAVHTGSTGFTRDDEARGEYPRALHKHQAVIRVPRPEHDGALTAVALLRGIQFQARCIDAEGQVCQSDGIWPYRFRLELAGCQDLDTELACPVTVEVGRAWTPGRGGVRGIEEKPLEQHMSIEVEVDWAVVVAPAERMLAHEQLFENALHTNRAMVLTEQRLPIQGLPTGFPEAAIGLNHLAFEFFPQTRRASRQERGRYLSGWSTRVRVRAYDPADGSLMIGHGGGLVLPKTVKRTGVSVEVGMVLLQLADPDAVVTRGLEAKGALCSPSSDEAPWFSRWDRCDKLDIPERTTQTTPLIDPRRPTRAEPPATPAAPPAEPE